MALMVALRNLASLIAAGNVPVKDEKIAIFSDELNHASIIDGIRLAERQRSVEFFVYKHCDMSHLRELLSNCKMKKKVVVTDRLVMFLQMFITLSFLYPIKISNSKPFFRIFMLFFFWMSKNIVHFQITILCIFCILPMKYMFMNITRFLQLHSFMNDSWVYAVCSI